MSAVFHKLIALLSSFGLAALTLVLLLILTFLGTIEQVDHGLHEVQRKYFDSFLVVYGTGIELDLPGLGTREVGIPLPGGQLLLWVLFVNLLVGGMVRLRKSRRTAGIFITHIGIAVMLAAGFVKYYRSDDGHLNLFEGESCDEFESYHYWEIAITRDLGDGRFREYRIPGREFVDMRAGEKRTFVRDELPFDLVLSHYMRNAWPRQKMPAFQVSVPVVDGFYLHRERLLSESEQNIAGAYATVVERRSGESQTGILFGYAMSPSSTAANPFVVEVDGQNWAIELRHERCPLPYTIRLDKFTARFHPRTTMASAYESEVLQIEGDSVRPLVIRMNEPLRAGGHVLFQSSYGPPNARPGDRMWSVFSVVRNPADQWPLISCIIIAVGLLLHFGGKLSKVVSAQSRIER